MQIDSGEVLEIFRGLDLTHDEIELIRLSLIKKNLSKGELLIKSGDIVDQTYGVNSGCLRSFYIDESGKEHTLQFAIKGWWITDYTAFFNKSSAIMNLEVLEDSIVYQLSYDQRENLFKQIPKLESFIRKRLESSYAAFQHRILSNLSKSAKERYLEFMTKYSKIEGKIKNYHIASYLGITTESLSRIRKEL